MDGNEGKMVTRAEARQMMTNYRNSNAFAANDNKEAILFGKNHINSLLGQGGCVGIRIYYGKSGITNSDEPHMILVGTDVNGNDMTSMILDTGLPCPNDCSSASTRLRG